MFRNALFVLLLIWALGAALANPFGALLAYLWFALFRPLEWIWFDLSSLRLSLVFGVILLLRSAASNKWPNLTTKTSVAILLFLTSGLIAQISAVQQDVGWHWMDYFFRLSIVCLLVISLVDTQRRFIISLCVISASLGFYTAKAGVFSLVNGGSRFTVGLAGELIDNNAFGLAAVMVTPLLLVAAQNIPRSWIYPRVIAFGCRLAALFSVLTTISTFSRGALLALLAGAITYATLFHRRRAVLLWVLLGVGISIGPLLPLPAGYAERMKTIYTFQSVGDDSALSRLYFWKVALNMVADNPLGVGMYNFSSTFDQYDTLKGRYGRQRAVHNSHLQALVENGFVGFAVWMWLFAYSLRTCVKIRRLAAQHIASDEGRFLWTVAGGLIASIVSFFVGGTFIAMALNELIWICFALVAALERIATNTLGTQETRKTSLSYVPSHT